MHPPLTQVEYLEFLEIMTTTLQRLAEEREADESNAGSGQVPFALMATAYRRKRLMEGIIHGDKEVMTQIMQLSEKQAQEAAAAAEIMALRRAQAKSTDPKRVTNSITKRSLQRLMEMHVGEDLLSELTPEERRLLSSVAAKAQPVAPASPRGPSLSGLPPPLPATRRGLSPPKAGARAVGGGVSLTGPTATVTMTGSSSVSRLPNVNSRYLHFSQTAAHKQLMEVPQLLDLKFTKSTIKLPPGTSPRAQGMGAIKSTASVSSGLPQLNGNRSGTVGYIDALPSFSSEASQYHRGSSATL